jgi:hypothetical protein
MDHSKLSYLKQEFEVVNACELNLNAIKDVKININTNTEGPLWPLNKCNGLIGDKS